MRVAVVLGCALTASALFAQTRTFQIRPDSRNVAQFHAEDSYDAFDGRTDKVSGTIVADPANPQAASVDVSVNMASLDTENSLRNHEMRDRYLEVSKYPAATFKSVSVAAPPSISLNQPAGIRVTGDFTLHGIAKRMTIPVHVTLLPDGRVHVTSDFIVHMPDFGIDVPHNVLVVVNDDIPVKLDLWAR